MREALLFNIQRYSIHDGEGIRTTVFFKGCPLSCRWCHNPEGIGFAPELIFYKEKCVSCGRCLSVCPSKANAIEKGRLVFNKSACTACGSCVESCPQGARELAGKPCGADALIKEVLKDRLFFEQSGGGVTLSGGEVMVQDPLFLEELCRKLYKEGISIFIDTCGCCAYSSFEKILPYVNAFLYDLKLVDSEEHRFWTGRSNEGILSNLKKLSAAGARLFIRIPVIGGVNASEEFFNAAADFLRNENIQPEGISLLPYHDFAKSKYANLDRSYPEETMRVPTGEEMEGFRELLRQKGYCNVTIGG